jgi:tetratricopeptide (TPR) repeat protein
MIDNNISSKQVYAMRKTGALDDAYQMATNLVNQQPNDDWNLQALAWCLIDLCKRESGNNNVAAINNYLQKLQAINFSSVNDILSKQIEFVAKLSNPANEKIQNAKQASKAGNHQVAVNIYREVLQQQPQNQDIKTSIGWELYRLIKPLIKAENTNVFAVKKLLNEYLQLQCERPALLHSLILGVADKLIAESNFNLVGFIKIWGIENLRDDDFQPYVDSESGKRFPCLAQKIVQHATKQAVEQNETNLLQAFIPLIDRVLSVADETIWLNLYKARALSCIGEHQKSFALAVEVAKQKSGDYWAWELLGDIQLFIDRNKALSCYCRALSSNPKEGFIAKLRLKLAELLVSMTMFSEAKYEVEKVIEARTREGWAIPDVAETLRNQEWFNQSNAVQSNKSLYINYSKEAETLLFDSLPWLNGCLGESFSLPDKPGKKRRKLYLLKAGEQDPVEVIIPDNKFNFNSIQNGAPIQMKGEFDANDRFNALQFSKRDSGIDWDIFPEKIGIVDHVNKPKSLIHVVIKQGLETVIPFKELPKLFKVGDAVLIRVSQSNSKNGVRTRAIDCRETSQQPSSSIFKPFSETVRVSNGLGFTGNDIFIDRPLIEGFSIEDGGSVSGHAVINFNKKRSTWGWKALTIEGVNK